MIAAVARGWSAVRTHARPAAHRTGPAGRGGKDLGALPVCGSIRPSASQPALRRQVLAEPRPSTTASPRALRAS